MTSESHDDVRMSFSSGPGQASEAGGRTVSDRPFQIVLVADAAAGKSSCIAVDKDNFKSVLASACPRAEVELSVGGSKPKLCDLKFASLSDLEPSGIAAQIPEAAGRLRARELILDADSSAKKLGEQLAALAAADPTLGWLQAFLEGKGGGDAGTAAPSETPAASEKGSDAGGSLLDMVDVEGSTGRDSETPASMLDPLFKAIAKSGSKGGPDAARRKKAVERLDQELDAILNEVYAAPAVRAVERAWRGIKFVVDRLDFRTPVKLSLLSAAAGEVVDRVREAVVDPVYKGASDAPSLIAVDKTYTTSNVDVEELSDLAELAASLPCVLAANAATGFLGVERFADIGKLPSFGSYAKEPTFIKWNALRSESQARFLGLVLGRILLRSAFAKSDPPKESFEFVEQPPSVEDCCWGGGALAMAVLAADSFAKTGWATRFTGGANGKLENLPLREYTTGLGHKKQVAGDLVAPDKRIEEFPLLGLNCLTAVPDKDLAVLCNGVSAHAAPTYQDMPEHVGWLEVSLPYQFFTCQISSLLYDLKHELDRMGDPEQIAGRVIVPIAAAMGVGEQAPNFVQATVAPPEEPGQSSHLVVTVTAPAHILPGGIEVNLALPLG